MSGGGEGDRHGSALLASGDRQPRRNAKALSTPASRGEAVAGAKDKSGIRALGADLFDLNLKRIASIRIVFAGDDVPQLVMFAGEPFLLGCGGTRAPVLTLPAGARAYRADLVISEAGE